jgi:hypothetical protein
MNRKTLVFLFCHMAMVGVVAALVSATVPDTPSCDDSCGVNITGGSVQFWSKFCADGTTPCASPDGPLGVSCSKGECDVNNRQATCSKGCKVTLSVPLVHLSQGATGCGNCCTTQNYRMLIGRSDGGPGSGRPIGFSGGGPKVVVFEMPCGNVNAPISVNLYCVGAGGGLTLLAGIKGIGFDCTDCAAVASNNCPGQI